MKKQKARILFWLFFFLLVTSSLILLIFWEETLLSQSLFNLQDIKVGVDRFLFLTDLFVGGGEFKQNFEAARIDPFGFGG